MERESKTFEIKTFACYLINRPPHTFPPFPSSPYSPSPLLAILAEINHATFVSRYRQFPSPGPSETPFQFHSYLGPIFYPPQPKSAIYLLFFFVSLPLPSALLSPSPFALSSLHIIRHPISSKEKENKKKKERKKRASVCMMYVTKIPISSSSMGVCYVVSSPPPP